MSGCGHPPTPLSKVLPNVLIIGDSISGDQLGYGPIVRDILELRSGPRGMPNGPLAAVQHNGGWTKDGATPDDQQAGATSNGVKCIDHWLGKEKWDVISFNFGLHDCEKAPQFTEPEVYQANLESITRAILAALKEKGTLVWTSTTPPPFPRATDYAAVACVNERNAIAQKTLARFHVKVEVNDLHTEMNNICGVNFTSCAIQLPHHNIHPTPVGRQLLAIKTASVIAPFLNTRTAILTPQLVQGHAIHLSNLDQPTTVLV